MYQISKLIKKDLVRGIPKIKFDKDIVCDACQKGKQSRTSFQPKDVVSTSGPSELLHLNLFGRTKTQSLGGKKYGMVIVDDFSRYGQVLFLAHKDKAFSLFEKFCKKTQNEKGTTIVSIRIMEKNLKIITLSLFMLKMVYLTISLVQELLNKMELWKEEIDLCKKWLEL